MDQTTILPLHAMGNQHAIFHGNEGIMEFKPNQVRGPSPYLMRHYCCWNPAAAVTEQGIQEPVFHRRRYSQSLPVFCPSTIPSSTEEHQRAAIGMPARPVMHGDSRNCTRKLQGENGQKTQNQTKKSDS